MNLTKRPPYQKGQRLKKPGNKPTASDRRYWERVVALDCIVGPQGCNGRITCHHCGTGAGGRKNHRKILPLCYEHHQGKDGIDGREHGMSKKKWQEKHGSEESLLELVKQRLSTK